MAVVSIAGCRPGPDPTPDTVTQAKTNLVRSVPMIEEYEHVLPEAERAWQTLTDFSNPRAAPREWFQRRPSEAERAEWQRGNLDHAVESANMARDFYLRFPRHPRARDARDKELELLGVAVQLGATNLISRLRKVEQVRTEDPSLSEDDRYVIRAKLVEQQAMAYQSQGSGRIILELEKGVRELLREFPRRPEPFELLSIVAANCPPDQAVTIAREITASPVATGDVKATADALLKRLAVVGSQLDLNFQAIDGREVRLGDLRGKVVLVDFWATWCAPCMQELPQIKAAYQEHRGRGFEVVGISLDLDRAALDRIVEHYNLPWPQHFDGMGWDNEFAKKLGVTSLPALWLVDRKGVVRDINGRVDLAVKVERLLEERAE
jgi:thiol-disulfide isomerase/thioredoxin